MPEAIVCPNEGVGACDTGLSDDHVGRCPRFTNSNRRSSLDTFIPLIMNLNLARLQMQVNLYAHNLSLHLDPGGASVFGYHCQFSVNS